MKNFIRTINGYLFILCLLPAIMSCANWKIVTSDSLTLPTFSDDGKNIGFFFQEMKYKVQTDYGMFPVDTESEIISGKTVFYSKNAENGKTNKAVVFETLKEGRLSEIAIYFWNEAFICYKSGNKSYKYYFKNSKHEEVPDSEGKKLQAAYYFNSSSRIGDGRFLKGHSFYKSSKEQTVSLMQSVFPETIKGSMIKRNSLDRSMIALCRSSLSKLFLAEDTEFLKDLGKFHARKFKNSMKFYRMLAFAGQESNIYNKYISIMPEDDKIYLEHSKIQVKDNCIVDQSKLLRKQLSILEPFILMNMSELDYKLFLKINEEQIQDPSKKAELTKVMDKFELNEYKSLDRAADILNKLLDKQEIYENNVVLMNDYDKQEMRKEGIMFEGNKIICPEKLSKRQVRVLNIRVIDHLAADSLLYTIPYDPIKIKDIVLKSSDYIEK